MRILVCGGRTYAAILKDKPKEVTERERRHIYRELYERTADKDPKAMLPDPYTVIIAGGASGADKAAIDWAVVNWAAFEEYKADWDKHGRAAGPIRNSEMLKASKPDIVLAFPGGRGTQDMIRKAIAAGVPTINCIRPGVIEQLNGPFDRSMGREL